MDYIHAITTQVEEKQSDFDKVLHGTFVRIFFKTWSEIQEENLCEEVCEK